MSKIFKVVVLARLLTNLACGVARRGFGAIVVIVVASSTSAYADSLKINATFDTSVDTFFAANAALFKSAFSVAAGNFTSIFDDNINVNILVKAVAGTGTLGSSSTPIFSTAFTTMRDGLSADRTSVDDTTATVMGGSVPSTLTDPIAATHAYWLTRAQEKALGLLADDSTNDGTITVGAGFTYGFDPSGGISAGTIDLIGVQMHEISEVMGRIGLSGNSVAGIPSYTLLDLFSYTGAGARAPVAGPGEFFSIDNGATLLQGFNSTVFGGDSRDWAGATNDSFNAFSSSGVLNQLSAVDVRAVDVIGYDLTSPAAVPEPTTIVLLGSGLVALIGARHRRRH